LIVAFNRRVDGATARLLSSIFLEIVIAPDFDEDALAVLREKKGLRLLRTGFWPGIEDGVDTVVRPRRGALGRGEGQGGAPGEVPGQVAGGVPRSEEHTSELQSRENLVCRLVLE